MKKTIIAILMAAILALSIAICALPLSAYAATDDDKYREEAEDTEAPQLAPRNQDFVAYWENPPETSFGYLPPPFDLSHLDQLPVEGLPRHPYALPSNFDWRDYSMVTPIKNQNPCGTCWDFGATTVLESAVLIGESIEYDFSEQSVALCVDRSWVYLYDESDEPCMAGGWSWLASEVFIKKGSVLESCNPYNPSALNCDGMCVCDTCPPIKNVDGYRLATNDGSQIDVIKNAIYNHEPVTVAYQHDSAYLYVDPTYGYIHDNYPCYGYANHLVSIIGWDNDVPHPNPSHGGTGAWIVKNSWGTGWGNSGFFYLAYDSSCAEEIAYLEYKDHDPAEELLYWDEAGLVSSAGYGDNDAWMASVFTADQASDLTHVDFWTTSNNAQYEIYVWDDFFGEELAHQTGSCEEYGYYSIPLSSPISRDAGQQFTVGVKMTTPGYNYPIPIEMGISGQVDPPIQTDVSFVRHTGSNLWTDFADYGCNACLRARMVSEVAEPDIWVEPTSFDVTLPPDTIYSTNLTIGNDGNATLIYNLSDIETTDGLGEPSIKETTSKTESSDVKLKDLTQKVEYPIGTPSGLEELLSPGEHEIAYDDGEVDYCHWWSGAGGAFGVHFTSPAYNTLSTVRFYICSDPATFDWKVLSWTGSQPGNVIASGTTTPTSSGWHDVDVGSISVPSDFVIAIYWREANRPTQGSDNDLPMYYRSWDYNAVEWSPENTVDYMIRAVMSTEEGWLSESPTNGTVEPKTQTNITVTFNTTGLSTGDYYADINIVSNDPDENPTIAPVNLTVTSVADTTVKVEPASQTVLPSQSFSVNVTVENVTDMASDGAILHFDPTAMQATDITAGVISSFPIEVIDNVAGTVTFGYALMTGSFSGSGPLATIEFVANASAEGTFDLNLTDVDLRRPDLSVIPAEVFNGTVTISGPPALVKVIPETQVVPAGGNFHINVTVENVTNMAADGAILHFDSNAMQATGITGGVIDTFPVEIIDNVAGTVTFAYALATGGFSGNGTLVTIEFTTDASVEGVFDLNLTDVELLDPCLNPIQREVFNGTVTLIPFNITIISPENRTYASKCVRLNFTVEPEGTALAWIGYSLDGGANVTIAGNTTVGSLSEGGHNIVVYANDTHGNMAASNTVLFTLHPADIDGDCRVYVSDLLLLAQAYNSRPGDANWNEDADLNCDDRVYTADLLILAQNYNRVYC